jgi:hypothetical protein
MKIAAVSGIVLILPALLTCAWAGEAPASREPIAGHLSYTAGARRLGGAWGDARDQFVFGLLDCDIRGADWPVSAAIRLTLGHSPHTPPGASRSADFSGTWELDLGVRKFPRRTGAVEPFVGAGVAVLGASTTRRIGSLIGWSDYDQTASDTTVGPSIEAGVLWPISKQWHMGVLGSWAHGRIHLGGASLDAGGFTAAFLVGAHWPRGS